MAACGLIHKLRFNVELVRYKSNIFDTSTEDKRYCTFKVLVKVNDVGNYFRTVEQVQNIYEQVEKLIQMQNLVICNKSRDFVLLNFVHHSRCPHMNFVHHYVFSCFAPSIPHSKISTEKGHLH